MTVFTLYTETVPEFIFRLGGDVPTESVATRFGWDARKARKKLRALAAEGEIVEIDEGDTWDLPESSAVTPS